MWSVGDTAFHSYHGRCIISSLSPDRQYAIIRCEHEGKMYLRTTALINLTKPEQVDL